VGVRKNTHSWSAAAAEAVDLGPFRHGHRLRNAAPDRAIGWIGGLGLLVMIILALNAQWLAILIIAMLVIPIVPCWMYLPAFAPYQESTLADPSRIAVYERGLVLDGGREGLRAVPWGGITGTGVAPSDRTNAYRVDYLGPDTLPASFIVGRLTGRGALLASVKKRAAVPARYWPRAAWAGAGAALIALYVWQLVVPQFGPTVIAQMPTDSYSLLAACQGDGAAYSSAPAYAGSGPHPVIVLAQNLSFSAQWTPDNLASTQLVACVKADGNTSMSNVMCRYSATGLPATGPFGEPINDNPQETDFVNLAEYQITVYTLRTHQDLGMTRVVGDDTTCPQQKLPMAEIDSQLTDNQLHQVLDPYVNRSA
jgi:hypothetical protein